MPAVNYELKINYDRSGQANAFTRCLNYHTTLETKKCFNCTIFYS